ncbi:type II toxin-antitoxin system VapC family toxin [Mastigocoleus testarum]|uniref:Twitching motility protein PilT n=1 Tax=Mastigocoleus testarum BC008 TaxID=371196 RepID=A0A0V7ZT34_9CYAN|nr:type II toxin-antitoxin system VapC family toxin [Mastigocoleus testarum]KST67779.1 twitching motility protein PilT [Mastigocoleus testarum BC008]
MIILDTHIWIWWVDDNQRLTEKHRQCIEKYQSQGLGISIISCWEVAKLVEVGRLSLSISVDEWLKAALAYQGVQLLELTIPIIVESTKLTGFHRDPADQIIVATARIHGYPLLTADAKILAYPNVQTLN